MRDGHLITWLATLSLLAAALLSPAAQAAPVQGSLLTDTEATLGGNVDTRTERGVLHARTPALSDLSGNLEAEALEVSYSWERGYGSPAVAGLLETQARTETGSDTIEATNVSATIHPFQAQPEVLGMLDPASSNLSSQGDVDATARVVEDQVLTQVEWSNSSQEVLVDFHGFQYTVEAPWATVTGLTTARISGTFDLFINNVTLDVSSSDKGAWAHWSGFRVHDEATGEYESRVTVVHVTNGTLELSSPGTIGVYGPQLATTVSDGVQARHASGTLSTDEVTYRFDSAPLRLSGPGEVVLRAQQAAGQARGDFSNERQSLLVLEPHGSFDVAHTQGLVVEEAPQSLRDSLDGWTPWLLALALILLAGYLARNRAGEHLGKFKAQLRYDRTSRWIQTGDRLFEIREYEDAMTWYQRIVKTYPNSLEGWNSIAACHQELGNNVEASQAYEKTHRMFTEGDPTSLASAMVCAYRAGDVDRAVDLAQELATLDPELARHRLGKPRLAELREKAGLSSLFRRDEPDGASYA